MPPPFIPAPNCARSQLFFTLDGQQIMWVLNFQRAAPFTEADRVQTNTVLHTWWTNNVKPQLSVGIALERIVTTNLDSASSPQSTLIISPAEPGLNGGGATLPGGTALVMTHRTALRGRNYRGRTYVAGINTTNQASPDVVLTTFVTNLTNAFFALVGLMNAINNTWIVLSKFLNKLPRGTAIGTPITAISADQFLDSQRRRLSGRGI